MEHNKYIGQKCVLIWINMYILTCCHRHIHTDTHKRINYRDMERRTNTYRERWNKHGLKKRQMTKNSWIFIGADICQFEICCESIWIKCKKKNVCSKYFDTYNFVTFIGNVCGHAILHFISVWYWSHVQEVLHTVVIDWSMYIKINKITNLNLIFIESE